MPYLSGDCCPVREGSTTPPYIRNPFRDMPFVTEIIPYTITTLEESQSMCIADVPSRGIPKVEGPSPGLQSEVA